VAHISPNSHRIIYSSPPLLTKRYPLIGLVIFAQVVILSFVHGVLTLPVDLLELAGNVLSRA
jgi:hypothetical protein